VMIVVGTPRPPAKALLWPKIGHDSVVTFNGWGSGLAKRRAENEKEGQNYLCSSVLGENYFSSSSFNHDSKS